MTTPDGPPSRRAGAGQTPADAAETSVIPRTARRSPTAQVPPKRGQRAQRVRRTGLNYPRAGHSGVTRWLPSLRLLTLFALLVIFLASAAVIYAYNAVSLPDDSAGDNKAASLVYYSDGKTLMGKYATVNRLPVPDVSKKNLSPLVVHAVLAAEDRSFYSNKGVSPRGIARSVVANVRGGSQQGGSTITQQYIRNYYTSVGTQKTYTRKIREAILAIKIDKQKSKDEILTSYLNTIWWGRHAYGVQAATDAYFARGTSPRAITVSQAAFLAGIIQSPGNDDPDTKNGEARARQRWQYVLDGMLAQKWISQQDHDSATFPTVKKAAVVDQYQGPQGHLLKYVHDELLHEMNGLFPDDKAIETGGLRIVTTIDKRAEDAAVAAMDPATGPFPKDGRAKQVHAGLASIDVKTGAVVAMYGGPDYLERAINDATTPRQPGSTFKAFTLTAALQQHIGLRSRWAGNSPLKLPGGKDTVHNEFNKSYGSKIDLVKAIRESVNTAFVDLTVFLTPKVVIDAAVEAGVPRDSPSLDAVPTVTLGTANVSPLSMALAYSSFAGNGRRADRPYIVKTVRDASGTLIVKDKGYKPEVRRVMPETVARDVSYALQQVVKNGTGTAALAVGRPVAGKTGTANLDQSKSQTTSAWFVGFTPQLATAVDFYRGQGGKTDDLDVLAGNSQQTFFGGGFPAQVWTAYMKNTLEVMKIPVADFPPPADIEGDKGRSLVKDAPTFRPTETASASPTASEPAVPTPTATPTVVPAPVDPNPPADPNPPPADPNPPANPPPDPNPAPADPNPPAPDPTGAAG